MKLHISAIYIDEDHVYCLLSLRLYNILLEHARHDLKASQLLMVAPTKRTSTKKSHPCDENSGADCDVNIFTASLEKWQVDR